MEDICFIGILFIFIATFVIYLFYFMRKENRRYRKRLFIYPKTECEYYVNAVIKMKSPDTGKWHSAILYSDYKKKQTYARDESDFLEKFVQIDDWENGNRESREEK